MGMIHKMLFPSPLGGVPRGIARVKMKDLTARIGNLLYMEPTRQNAEPT